MITYQRTTDLSKSAEITYYNMQSYYDHYNVDWKLETIEEQIVNLENWDILYDGILIGAIRLGFESDCCYIRDLQVSENFQNKGIGKSALGKCNQLAKESGLSRIRLRVFKISPAIHLYERTGFLIDKDEDNFYYMSRNVAE